MRAIFIAVAALAVAGSPAIAGPRVVIVETRTGPALPALATQVGVHAGRGITIVTVTADNTAGLAARASRLLVDHDATLVAWVEAAGGTAPDDQVFVVYVAGPWPDRALIELVRVPAQTPPSEIERTIALKLAGLLDDVLAPRPIATPLGIPVEVTRDGRSARWSIALGVDVAVGGGDRDLGVGPALSVSRAWSRAGWRITADANARWLRTGVIADPIARVAIDEASAGLGGSVGRSFGAWRAVATLRLAGALISADGTTSDGRTGGARVTVPIVGTGVGIQAPLSSATVVLGIGFERALIRQRFLVDGEVAADLGRTRLMVGIAVSVAVF